MIKGIGIDLVENNRIKNLFDKYGEKFDKKILSHTEMSELIIYDYTVNYIYKNFAYKEEL